MGDTLQEAIESVMRQIDDEYEVILVDDGSTDSSVQIATQLAKTYWNLHLISLQRDPNRRLGQTRNISIQESSGEWCIFHLDTDDEIGSHIREFVSAVTELSDLMPRDVLFSGQQIHMAKKQFLLSRGPFRNIYRGEDRDLYMRLVKNSEWIVIKHKRFIRRLKRSWLKLLVKNIRDNFDQSINDLQNNVGSVEYLKVSFRNRNYLSYKIILFRLATLPFAARKAKLRGEFQNHDYPTHSEFLEYRKLHTKSFSAWLKIYGQKIPSKLNSEIFD
jgi:glycosyltransferase involved in cell wall biosynthesis